MVGMWALLYLTGEIPELTTAPLEIGYHLFAEGLTAGLLLIAGYGLFRDRPWAASVHPLALGLLLYTVINSTGYYAQRGDVAMVGMFTVLTLTTGAILVDLLRDGTAYGRGKSHLGRRPYV